MKQTAVEWLFEKLPTIDKYDPYYSKIIEQAKEMERQEIIDAYNEADTFPQSYHNAENYYNKNFKK
jgi:hypothetical protein